MTYVVAGLTLAIVVLVVERIAVENEWREERDKLRQEIEAWKLAATQVRDDF